jgi:serine/threonine protein kinase
MQIFNRYEYNPQTDIAGRGEFSRVYKAVDTTNDEVVAIKIYKINNLFDHYRPVQNAEIIQTLDHTGLCSYFKIQEIEKEDSFGETEKLQVCITSFMNAGSLVHYYKSHPDLTLFKKLLLDVLNGLSCLHKKGIIHGYIKPSNILVTEINGLPAAAITDFGMGIFSSNASSVTASYPLSAISYLSPEQLNATKYGIDGKISFNTDIWSLALVVYEALTGEPLFTIGNTDFTETITNRITSFELPEKIQTLPAPFNEFLALCLVKDASQRVKTVEELLPLFSQPGTAAENMLILEGITLISTEEKENTDEDVTRIIALPKKDKNPSADLPKEHSDDDTKIITTSTNNIPVVDNTINEIDEDVTRIIAKPTYPQPAENSLPKEASETNDDTKIIAAFNNNIPAIDNTVNNIDDDATRIIAKPAYPQPAENSLPKGTAETDEDATRVIGKHEELPSADKPVLQDDVPVDQTIFITKVNKEKQNTDSKSGTDNSKQTADGEKQPDIIIRRREKPVVLFNRYEYLPATDLIGKGGFSRVYKAFDKKLSRWVALKIYKTGEFSDRYSPIAEIKRVVNLDHPNICRYLDIEEIENENPFGENEKIQVCVMELLDSGNFADYYKANKNPETLKKLIQDILNGLSYLHKNGIIHRDIKPANILIKQTIEGPVAKITDFGISKNSEAENNNSSSALIVSIPYMAPEQLNAKKYGINEKVSFNLDLWSLGVTIYEVATGKVLFKNSDQDNSEQIMANIMAPELPEKLNDLPEPFKTIVSHCVIKNARERASRAEELMVLLHTTAATANPTDVLASQAANTLSVIEKEDIIPVRTEPETPKMEMVVLPVDTTEKKSMARFSMADGEERSVGIREKKKPNYLLLFIGTAVLIFIGFIIYLKTGNQNPDLTNTVETHKKDTAKKVVTVPLAPPDTTRKNLTITEKAADTVAKHTEVAAKPVHVTEKKKEKPAEENRKKEKQQTENTTSNTAAKYVLILSAEESCTLKVNSIVYGEVQVGKPWKLYLTTGKYILQFISTSNSASTLNTIIEVKPEKLGHADKFKIQLK